MKFPWSAWGLFRALAVLPTLGLAESAAFAQTQLFWNTNGSPGLWLASNWSLSGSDPFTMPWGSGATAHFTSRSSLTFGTTLLADVIVDPGVAVTVTAGGSVYTGNTARTIDVGAGGSLTWTNQAVMNNTPTGFIKTGAGTWTIGAQPNPYIGGFTLAQGTVVVSGSRSFGTGLVTLAGGTVQSSGGITFAAASLVVAGNVTLAGSGNDVWSMPATVLAGQQVLTNTTTGSATRTFSGAIAGPGSLMFTGAGGSGGIVLSGASTYTGGTVVAGGLVRAQGAASLGSGPVEVRGGKLALGDGIALGNRFTVTGSGLLAAGVATVINGSLGGDGTVSGSLRLGAGALLQPGLGVGTLHLAGDLTLEAGATLLFDLSASGSDLLFLEPGASLTSNGATLRPVFADGLGPAGSDSFWSFAQFWTVASGSPTKAITGTWVIDNSAWAPQGAFATWRSGDNLILGWQPASSVPEPATYACLAGMATMGLACHRRRIRIGAKKRSRAGGT
jgi:autotransporter-associated beta strand protein